MNDVLSVIIPVFNEKETLQAVIKRLSKADFGSWNKEIIIIDDGSTDGTAELIESLPNPIIKILLQKNVGKGSAIKAGLAKATGSYCVIQDADLEYHPNDIPLLLAEIYDKESSVVYGSRNLRINTHRGDLVPRLGVWFITKLTNVFFGLKLTDIWTCYKLFPRRAAALFTHGRFESEIAFTANLANNGFQIVEVPISYVSRDIQHGKKIKYRDGIVAIGTIVRIYLITRGILLRYLIAGGIGLTMNIAIYTLLLVLGVWYVTAAIVAFSLATIVSFFLQKYWTFSNGRLGKEMTAQFGLYLIVAIGNVAAASFLVFLFVDKIGIDKILSEVLASITISIWSYFIYASIFRLSHRTKENILK